MSNIYRENYNAYNLLLMEDSTEYAIGMPHDRLFKDILNDKKEFCGFINNFIKDEEEKILLPENVERVSTSYIITRYISTESDVLYKLTNENKYYLIEHQSTIDEIIKYILEPVIGEEETEEMLKTFNKLGGEEIMTAVDCLIRDIEIEKEEARKIGLQEGRSEGREEGRSEGRLEGREEGIEKAKIMIAKKLIKDGFDIEKICEITGLTKTEVEENCY